MRGSGLSHTTLLRVPLFKYKQNINSWHFARSLEKLLVVRQLQPVYDSMHVTYKNAGFEYFVNPRFAKYSKPIPEIAEEQHTKTNTWLCHFFRVTSSNFSSDSLERILFRKSHLQSSITKSLRFCLCCFRTLFVVKWASNFAQLSNIRNIYVMVTNFT